ncbi:hypothetical protein [Paenibacillus sp. IHBB 10380]|uniref:hypothetical protein n=1 Tax=Paenibacillus sp. IHBB 10380 TaxID=1566358 RepID=UPI0005CFD258|nr:hypothetical protein [Paenibacillus sp. IHBB 10380]AJS60632.1 hypothetical protein UB51_21685 [Paenibacillus sp. IHBB 10380]
MKKKGLLIIALAIALIGTNGAVSAAESPSEFTNESTNIAELDKNEQHEVEALLDELITVRMQKAQINQDSISSVEDLNSQDEEIMNELSNKGVHPITEEERALLNKSITNGDYQSKASQPPTWGPFPYVDMLTYGEKSVTVSGKTYKIWVNYAVPKDGGGPPLVKNWNSVKLSNQKFESAIFKKKVFNLILQRAAGTIPYISWTPYDYFWPEATSYTSFDTYDLLVSYSSKMKYVWVYTPSTALWQLKASANNVITNETHVVRGYKNGSFNNVTKVKSNNMWSDSYDSIETIAVTAGSTFTSPVKTLTYKDVSGGSALSFFPYYANGPLDLY